MLKRVFCIMLAVLLVFSVAAAQVCAEDSQLGTAVVLEPDIMEETEPVTRESVENADSAVSVDVKDETADGGISNPVPLFFQTDYPDQMYGIGTVANNGCGITCLAMVATYMTGHTYLPDELARYFGGKAQNNIDRLEYGADKLQLVWEKSENWHKSLQALKEGKVVIALMGSKSVFTSSQHFIVLTGITADGKILVNDPNKNNYDHWRLKNGLADGFDSGDIVCGYSGGWIFDKDSMPEKPFVYAEEQVEVECRYPDIELSRQETHLLARVVWVEARGECAEGQQAVAEVVLNRLVSEDFPDTLHSVIYAEGQFCSVPYLDAAEPSQTQYEAIDRALNGPYVLPMNVTRFATYKTTDEVWGKIGGHYFFYQP